MNSNFQASNSIESIPMSNFETKNAFISKRFLEKIKMFLES